MLAHWGTKKLTEERSELKSQQTKLKAKNLDLKALSESKDHWKIQ